MIREAIQVASLAIALYTIYALLRWSKGNTMRRLWAIPVIGWMGHTAIFYGWVMVSRVVPSIPDGFFTDWSSVLRLHGYITVASIVYTLDRLGRQDA